MNGIQINAARLAAALQTLGKIGAYTENETGLVGVCRLALSDEDKQARELVCSWMQELGLTIEIDQIGNIYARRDGRDPALEPVLLGSHIDSVPTGGRYDGVLGVLGALEIIRTLNEHKIITRRPVVACVFTDEEGCRFGTDMLGSAVATGRIPLEDAYSLTDKDGYQVREELKRIGYLGERKVGTLRPHAFLECHVEQGPTLIREGHDIGVVTMVQAIAWYALTITGRAAHAGATPTAYRADAGLAAAQINIKLREMVDSGDYGELRATMGVIRPQPDMVNVIPGRVEATLDLRNPDDQAMNRAEADILAYIRELEQGDGIRIRVQPTARTNVVPFSPIVQAAVQEAASSRGLSARKLFAGAGHDAQEWASVCTAGMVFVPGQFDGISHNPRELSTEKQCADGINVLLDVLLSLANES